MERKHSLTVGAVAFLAGALLVSGQDAAGTPSASTATQLRQLQAQVKTLSTEVTRLKRSKADNSKLVQVAEGVLLNTTTLQSVTPSLTGLQSGLTSLQASTSALTLVVGGKANTSDVALKADSAALAALAARVSALEATR